jgi:MYXO-CTERM domain-containing protein
MCKKFLLSLCAFLVSICVVSQVKAQSDADGDGRIDNANNVTTTAADGNDGFDWGWLGLLGLLGLAGARGKDRSRQQ